MNDIHWNGNPRKHLKGQNLYKACLDVMCSNVNTELCNLLTKHCKVCQIAVKRYLPNAKVSKPVSKKGTTKILRSYVHVNILRIDSLLIEKAEQVVTHVITVVYQNGFTEFIPTFKPCQKSICGHLYHSFSRNCMPLEIFLVFRTGSSTDRHGDGTDITNGLLEYEETIISSINSLLPEREDIVVKTGARVNCPDIEYPVSFLLECFINHGNIMTNDTIILNFSLMQEHVNQQQKFSDHTRRSIQLNAKEEAISLFGSPGANANETISGDNIDNDDNRNYLFFDERIASPHVPHSLPAQTPVKSKERVVDEPIENLTPLQNNKSQSVNRELHIPNGEDGLSIPSIGKSMTEIEFEIGIRETAELMADNMMDDIVNNPTFDTAESKGSHTLASYDFYIFN
jgi:hypothetical protein